MEEEKIIQLYLTRDEQAIRLSMEQYGAYCRTVAAGILPDSADVEEAVSDTWLKAWQTIPPQHPRYLRLYLGRIARNAALSIWRRNNAYCRGGGETALALEELGEIVGSDSLETDLDCRELERTITAFLKTEPVQRRNVFLRRYFYMEELQAIAERYGLREGNVRVMLSRTRQRLRKYLKQEGYQL